MSRVINLCFSPTGTTQKVASMISDAFGKTSVSVNLCDPIEKDMYFAPDDVCVFAAPCFGGRLPEVAENAINRIHGNQTPAVICVSFGNRAYDDALIELADLVTNNGFRVVAGCAAVTEHSLVRDFGKGRPDNDDVEEIKGFAADAAKKLASGDMSVPEFPGNRPYLNRSRLAMPFYIDRENCVNCGNCQLKCPVGAVISGSWESDLNKCIGCMRCEKVCPMQCRKLGPTYRSGLKNLLGPMCAGRKANEFFL